MTDIARIVRFKQQLNDMIDECVEKLKIIQPQDIGIDKNFRILENVMNYYQRTLRMYSLQKSDSDSDNDSDKTYLSDESDQEEVVDYTGVIGNRLFVNHNNIRDIDLENHEKEIRKKLFGFPDEVNDDINFLFTSESTVNPPANDTPNTDAINNGSTNTQDQDEDDESDEDCGNFILNNKKQTLLSYVDENEIEVSDTAVVDYNDPVIG